ncbi:hypothetical protein [Bradyrhizobium sp. 169]|uniref:hypothetical protein n=1 Tax=Bradyrhizobium sp. 169 TaxID=2782640 RepID=UPI001FF861B0|nr:hypothetical protein [Bradyrhizobium sp. 169]MCK1590331.1 hypothetical protein [Bradyrhizobium sp. 169]
MAKPDHVQSHHPIVVDDEIGQNGDYTFTGQDLLANDHLPRGENIMFAFGLNPEATWNTQVAYLRDHGIIYNPTGNNFFVTYEATDFQYSVSVAGGATAVGHARNDFSHAFVATVDVTAPPKPPTPHAGDLLFSENFDNFGQTSTVPSFPANLADHGWYNVNNGGNTAVNLQPHGSLDFYLNTKDTQGFDLLVGHTFTDPTGGQFEVSFDFSTLPGMNVQESLNVLVDDIFNSNIVASFKGVDYQASGWQHVDLILNSNAAPNATHTVFINEQGGSQSTITSIGFAVDNIQVHDWII